MPEHAWALDRHARYRTEARFAWDRDNLYVALRCHEPDLAALASALEGPAQHVDAEDRVYLYIDPGYERASKRFLGIILPASGIALGPYGKQGDLGKPIKQIRYGREPDAPSAWTVEAAIPWDRLLHDPWEKLQVKAPRPGMRMGLNLLRHRLAAPAEISVWSRSYPWAVAAPHWWGTLRLE